MLAQALHKAFAESPYSLDLPTAVAVAEKLLTLNGRVQDLRDFGQLTDRTLKRYYGMTRFQQVAESNAIEGSTLSVGETQLAIMKGITLTGHDPAYVRDAIALDRALSRLAEMARLPTPTDLAQVKELHGIILEGNPSAGMFRTVPVRLSGSAHRPPKTWEGVMDGMENWNRWSEQHFDLSPLIRATILHAWLTHIHPFVDGNGRISRAITNLELVRAGYPPIIIRRNQDRDRYISALALSDQAGDIAGFLDLVVDRFEGALVGLESAAHEVEGYSAATVQLRRAQQRRLEVWNASVELLFRILIERLTSVVEAAGGEVNAQPFRESLTLEEYIHLCEGAPVLKSWAFVVRAGVPGLDAIQRLAWIGFRSPELRSAMGHLGVAAPSLFWSKPNPQGYPPWILCSDDAPGVVEMSITPGAGDDWQILSQDVQYESVTTTELARRISEGFSNLLTGGSS